MGNLDADGDITWAAAEQTLRAIDAEHSVGYPTIEIDSDGYPWVSYMYASAPAYTAPYVATASKSSTKDGTWTDVDGFPYSLKSNNTLLAVPVCVPMTGTKMFCAYTDDSGDTPHYGREWNGSSWEDEEAVTATNADYSAFDLAAAGDYVHLGFHATMPDGKYDALYRTRNPSGTWGTETTLIEDTTVCCPGPVLNVQHDRIHVFWWDTNNSKIQNRQYSKTGGVLTGATDVVDESGEGIGSYISLQTIPSSGVLDPALAYVTGADPYDTKVLRYER